jgi:hypothetical protein
MIASGFHTQEDVTVIRDGKLANQLLKFGKSSQVIVELEISRAVSPLMQAVGYMEEFAYIDTYIDRHF